MTIVDLLKGVVYEKDCVMRQGIMLDIYTLSLQVLSDLDKNVIRGLEPYYLAYIGAARPLEYSALNIESAAKFDIGVYRLLYSAPVLRFKSENTFMKDFYDLSCPGSVVNDKVSSSFVTSFKALLAPVTEDTYVSGDWPERKHCLVNELDPTCVILTNVRFFFLFGCGYESKSTKKKPTHYYNSSDKKHVIGEEMVVEFVKRSDDSRFACYLNSFSFVNTNKKILSLESYYVQHDLSLIFSESLVNYKEIMRLLLCLYSIGVRKVYCPGDGLGIGVMCGISLRERGYSIEVRGSDKYLCDFSPVVLDRDTLIDNSYFYLCVNSYSFCCKEVGKDILVYDRQSPAEIDRVNRINRTWVPVRPFMNTTNFARCHSIDYVSLCEFDRGPLSNSVFMSLSDGDDPFDKTVRARIKLIDDSKDLFILRDNASPVYFRGSYRVVEGKHLLTFGKGRYSSYHYLSFPNDLMDICSFENNIVSVRNRAVIFWSSSRLLHLDHNCVKSFKNGDSVSYVYYVTIPVGTKEFTLRYRRGNGNGTVMFVLGSGFPFNCRATSSELTYFNQGLCEKFVQDCIIGTPLQKLFMKSSFVPREDMIRDCANFCLKYCTHGSSVVKQ